MAQTFGFMLYVLGLGLGLVACVLGLGRGLESQVLGLGLGLVAYVLGLGLAISVLDSITDPNTLGAEPETDFNAKWSFKVIRR